MTEQVKRIIFDALRRNYYYYRFNLTRQNLSTACRHNRIMSSLKNKVNTDLCNLMRLPEKSYISHAITEFAYILFQQNAKG